MINVYVSLVEWPALKLHFCLIEKKKNQTKWVQAKKLTARSEKEATEADLLTAKMQIEAADEAEDTKKRFHKSM